MIRPLENKRALVTGGSRGIGATVVRRLAREGAHVVLTYVGNPDQANGTVRAVRALGVTAQAVLSDSADARAVVAAGERPRRVRRDPGCGQPYGGGRANHQNREL